ncbi:MAG: hypothetical protein ACR2NA_01800 [Solirubrobacterales bacterium]
MLFDLRGKRKRLVQAIYLGLAILMGAGLVLFGIGGEVSGGLLDGLGLGGGSGSGQPGSGQFEQRAADLEEQAETSDDPNVLKELARTRYLAGNAAAEQTSQPGQGGQQAEIPEYGQASRQQFDKATAAWEQYLDATDKPDSNVATLITNAYAILNDPQGAAEAQALVAEARPAPATLFELARYQYFAGDTKEADKAAAKAVEMAPKADRKALKEQISEIKKAAKQYAEAQQAGQDQGGGQSNPFSNPLGGSPGQPGGGLETP